MFKVNVLFVNLFCLWSCWRFDEPWQAVMPVRIVFGGYCTTSFSIAVVRSVFTLTA